MMGMVRTLQWQIISRKHNAGGLIGLNTYLTQGSKKCISMGTRSGQQTPNGYPSLGSLQLSQDLIIFLPNLLERVHTTKWSSNQRYSLSYPPTTSHNCTSTSSGHRINWANVSLCLIYDGVKGIKCNDALSGIKLNGVGTEKSYVAPTISQPSSGKNHLRQSIIPTQYVYDIVLNKIHVMNTTSKRRH